MIRRNRARPFILRSALLATALIAASPGPAAAGVTVVSPDSHRSFAMIPNKTMVVRLDRAPAQALVANAEIADVVPMPGNAVYILAKKAGATSLTFYDARQTLIAVVDLSVGPDADGFLSEVKAAMPRERLQVRASRDNLIISGTVSNAIVAQRIMAIAETFAPKNVVNLLAIGSAQQVLLEVRISEMRRSTVQQLGIRSIALSNNFAGNTGDAPTTSTFGTFAANFGIGGLNINLALDALESKGMSTTLAQPNLMAMSGETASFLAGGELPIPVASTVGPGGVPTITIEYKQFGVSLNFQPTVLEDGIINLVVAPEVSAIDNNISIRTNGVTVPGLQTRRAKTTIELRDGESFAVAGLLSADGANSARQVPLLGNIPILGALFRSSSFQRGETELVIVVTPHLVRPVAAGSIALPTDRLGQASPETLGLLGKVSAPQRPPLPASPAQAPR